MPLLDLGGTVTVAIDGDEYVLRERISWRQRRSVSMAKGLSIHLPWGQIEGGTVRIGKHDLVPVTPDALEDVQMARLQTWLLSWSHKPKITISSLERLPDRHVDTLLDKIAELEALQDGPDPDSPLDDDSKS